MSGFWPRLGSAILWSLPYLVSGFSAPLIFKMTSTPQIGGHFAGALFMIAGVWSLLLAFGHHYPLAVKAIFVAVFVLQLIFWTWRFFISAPLKESFLFGINGGAWHGILTSLYLICAVLLLVCEYRITSFRY